MKSNTIRISAIVILIITAGYAIFIRYYTPSPPPNIILIVTDDQSYRSLEKMPTVYNELVQNGVNFTQGYVTTSACCPSRASILTGQYARNHGVLVNLGPRGGALKLNDESTIATWLQDDGYKTGFIGKYLNEYWKLGADGYIPPGWDEWHAFVFPDPGKFWGFYRNYTMNENGIQVEYGLEDEDYSTKVIKRKALQFIRESTDVPFFLYLGFIAPHGRQHYLKKDEKLFDSSDFEETPNYLEKDISDKPDWAQTREVNPDKPERIALNSMRSLIPVDNAVRRILETLKEHNLIENTVIIFTSDNGLSWGEHFWADTKGCAYEECVKVPFVVYYPKLIKEAQTVDAFVLNIDLAPTIAEFANVDTPAFVDGKSFVPLLTNPEIDSWRDEFIIEFFQLIPNLPPHNAIRTKEWKLIEYPLTNEFELYDMVNDPWEMENVADNIEYAEIRETLYVRLLEMIKE